jgi:hypothetical protein
MDMMIRVHMVQSRLIKKFFNSIDIEDRKPL